MQIIVAITTSFSIAFALCLVTYKFILPNRITKFGCFIGIFFAELVFMLFFPETPGITEIAYILCIPVIAFSTYSNLKSYLKCLDIAFSILLLFNILFYVIGTPIAIVLSMFLSFDKYINSYIMQMCILGVGVLLRKYKDNFFKPSDNAKILKFHLTLKVLIFTIINFVFTLSISSFPILYYIAVGLFTAITVVGFLLIKYNSKLNMELENENRRTAFELINLQSTSEQINARYEEIIRVKHFFRALYRSLVTFIKANDMPGLEEYFNKNIAPINEQLDKEVEAYDQVQYIHYPILKARIIELINTTSQMPNVKFVLNMSSVLVYVKMADMDLFTILNIWIENAIEEVTNQESGEIIIEMSQTDKEFDFKIRNTIIEGKSTPKPNNTHKGLKIAEEILKKYSNAQNKTYVITGFYVQTLKVIND